jgi:RNA polymerase sigma-70 factor, ECF subfamily
MTTQPDRQAAEVRFRSVFAHFGAVNAYARRRGSHDPEALAAEAMAVAWRRLADVPTDDARPWLFATARNLLLAEWRQRPCARTSGQPPVGEAGALDERVAIDPGVARALATLSVSDREALLLIAWEDLSPKLAARALGMSEGAFRVRLHRARRRVREALAGPTAPESRPSRPALSMEDR